MMHIKDYEFRQLSTMCMIVFYYFMRKQIQASIPNQQHVPNSTQITPTKGYQAQAMPPNQVSGRWL